MKPITNLLIAGLLMFAQMLLGQNLITSFSPTSITANVGENVSVEFRVTNFTNINSIQLPIGYNASVLRFDSLDVAFFGPDDPVLPNYGDSTTASHPNAGKVVFTWFPNLLDYPDGYTLPANTRLFTLHFTVIGNGTANVNVSAVSPGIEVIRNDAPISTTNNSGSAVTGGNGQPTYVGFKIIANQIHIPKDHVGCMPITVNDFDSLWSMQFAMHWDPTIIRYECIRAFNLPDFSPSNIGTQNAPNGTLIVGWVDPGQLPAGSSRVDGAKIFDICFTAIGAQGTNSLVTIDGIGFSPNAGSAEAINSSSQDVWESTSGITDTAYVIPVPPPANAVRFTVGTKVAGNGTVTCVPVTVNNHSNVTNAEYIITVNSTLLAFQSIDLGANPMGLVLATNFNTVTAGRVRFTYNNIAGVTVPNDAAIFNVCYTVGSAAAAPLGTEIPVNITSAACSGGGPFPVSVFKKTIGGFPIQIVSGKVTVGTVGPPDATFGITNVTCFGLSNGIINTTVTNGTATGYSWSGPGNFTSASEDPSGLAAGTYLVTVTLSGGSTIVRSATVTAPTALQIPTNQITITPVKCTGETTGAISLAPTGGTSPYTYLWSGPASFTSTQQNLTNLDNGTYNVTVTDNKGCTLISQPLSVLEASSPLTAAFNASTNIRCIGEANGSAQITVNGGQTPYGFSWRDFNNQQVAIVEDPAGLAAGVYNVVVTDAFGCTRLLPAAVTIAAPPTALSVTSLITNVNCNGGNSGAVSLTISGGWPGAAPTISWNNALPSIPNPTGIPSNTYTATVTDNGGCVVTHVATVTQPAAIVIDNIITPQAGALPTGAIDLIIVSGGVAPLGYSWTGPNNFTAITQDISGLFEGAYSVIITDASGCTRAAQFNVTNDNVLSVLSVVGSCSNNGCINLNLTSIAAAPFIITLASSVLPGGSKVIQTSDATPELCDLPAGFYSINVADASSNVYNIAAVQVEQLQQAIVTQLTSNPTGSNNNGSITLSHSFSSDFGYLWNTGSVDSVLTNLAAGTYTVTVTNTFSGCTAVNSYVLTANNPLLVNSNLSNPNCLTTANGAIILVVNGGTGPYTFNWTGPNNFIATTQTLSLLSAGTYFVTVSDQSGALFNDDFTLTTTNLLAVSNVNETSNYGFGYQVSGVNNCDGAATVLVTNALGTVTVQWSNGETSLAATELCGGAYTVTVTDQSGCSAVWSDNLLAPTAIVGTSSVQTNYNGFGVSCYENCDGAVGFTPTGGVPPYTVEWPTGQMDNIQQGGIAQAENLCGGIMVVTVTDFLGASLAVTINISRPDSLVVEFSEIPPTTFNSCDGEILAVVPAAVGTFTVDWSTNFGKFGQGPRAEDLCANEIIQFVVEDANGCIATGVDTLYSEELGCMQVRPVITPGLEDGKNDFLLITCAESITNQIEIYNRFGQLVFAVENYDNSSRVWDGKTDSGKPLAEGVYYYVLSYTGSGGEAIVDKGHVNLLR